MQVHTQQWVMHTEAKTAARVWHRALRRAGIFARGTMPHCGSVGPHRPALDQAWWTYNRVSTIFCCIGGHAVARVCWHLHGMTVTAKRSAAGVRGLAS
jgi:hypothetical protein